MYTHARTHAYASKRTRASVCDTEARLRGDARLYYPRTVLPTHTHTHIHDACVRTHARTFAHVRELTSTYAHVFAHTRCHFVRTNVSTHMQGRKRTHVRGADATCTHARTQVHARARTSTHARSCVCARALACLCVRVHKSAYACACHNSASACARVPRACMSVCAHTHCKLAHVHSRVSVCGRAYACAAHAYARLRVHMCASLPSLVSSALGPQSRYPPLHLPPSLAIAAARQALSAALVPTGLAASQRISFFLSFISKLF